MQTPKRVNFEDGFAILGQTPECFDVLGMRFPLIVADPPYGGILDRDWDKTDPIRHAHELLELMRRLVDVALPGAAAYVFGGVGTWRNRPFYRFLADVETETRWVLSNHITWAKKRAYGVQHNYLFCREEIAYFVLDDAKKPRRFVVPLLAKKRGYAGYDPKHPAKSEFLRRTNVWTDITEILRGKQHECEKPVQLATVAILAHTEPGEYVLDPFAGSGSTALACRATRRRFAIIERDEETFDRMAERLRAGACTRVCDS